MWNRIAQKRGVLESPLILPYRPRTLLGCMILDVTLRQKLGLYGVMVALWAISHP